MYSMIDGVYDAFTEMMHYFYFEFNIYCVLLFIVFLNFVVSVLAFVNAKKGKKSHIQYNVFHALTSILAGVGLLNALFFQGVLADISGVYSKLWFSRVFVLSIIAFVLFVVQIALWVKTDFDSSKNE